MSYIKRVLENKLEKLLQYRIAQIQNIEESKQETRLFTEGLIEIESNIKELSEVIKKIGENVNEVK